MTNFDGSLSVTARVTVDRMLLGVCAGPGPCAAANLYGGGGAIRGWRAGTLSRRAGC
jgi:hypothetical protein